MKLVVFGLTISSSWGNGHATLWRGLCRALADRGHSVTFFERDAPYYALHRDTVDPAGCELRLYSQWSDVWSDALGALTDADVGMVTSFCPDACEASNLVLASNAAVKAFYDMDTPITLHALGRGERPAYLPADGLGGYDIVFSFSGGRSLDLVCSLLGARNAAPLYGSVDPAIHHRVPSRPEFHADLSYIGTYAANREEALDRLFLEPARCRSAARFVLAGSQYPADFQWAESVWYLSHLPPADHSAFYSSSSWTLNITRGPMAALGHCPSGRLFEAAACATPILTDGWDGLDAFFTPGEEVVIVNNTDDVLVALDMTDNDRDRIGMRARERALDCHTAAARATEFERVIEAITDKSMSRIDQPIGQG
jgi:spore maturation protein CgeB